MPEQRPCVRCVSNKKEEQCLDIQHKKRGRPRLNDDRDSRYDSLRPQSSRDVSQRRHLNLPPLEVAPPSPHYPPYYPRHSGFEGPLGHHVAIRQNEHTTSANPTIYRINRPPMSSGEEPIAYLTPRLNFLKGSTLFWNRIGVSPMSTLNLGDVVIPDAVAKVSRMAVHFYDESKRREPNYLNPIAGSGIEQLQDVGFTAQDIANFSLDYPAALTFQGGGPHPLEIRAGLAKKGLFYFVILRIVSPPRHSTMQNSSVPRAQEPYGSAPSRREEGGRQNEYQASFGPVHHSHGDVSGPVRGSPYPPIRPLNSAGHVSSPGRMPTFQSEAHPPGSSATRSTQPDRTRTTAPDGQANFQLPSIRPQQGGTSASAPVAPGRPGGDRGGRLDIGGLIEKDEGRMRMPDGRR